MYRVGHLLGREGLTDDVGPVDGAVAHIDLDEFAEELLVEVPDDGVFIHGHAGVLRVIHQRVADGLHVGAVRAYLIIRVDDAIDGVGADVVSENLERVGVHEQRVTLRIVDADGTPGGHGIARGVVVLAVVAGHHVLVHRVGIDHVPVGIVGAVVGIVIDAVADERAALVADDGAPEELGALGLGVVIAVFAVDMAGAGGDMRRTDDVGPRGPRVVVERVGGEVELLVLQAHVEIEDGLLRVGMVLAPVGGERHGAIDELAALEEIAEVVHAVVVERVGIERRLAVLEHHIVAGLRQLVVAVVVGILAGEAEGVALHHTHMAEGLEGVRLLVEMGTVAVEVGTLMAEMDMAVEHLRVTVAVLVVVQVVGVYEIDALVFLGGLRLLARGSLLGRGHGEREGHHRRQQKERDIARAK